MAYEEHDPSGSRFETALAQLRRELEAGRFRDADMLPSERELAETLAVSRTTLRRVLARLSEEGRLTQRQGIGTFIKGASDTLLEDHPVRLPDPIGSTGIIRSILEAIGPPTSHEALIFALSVTRSVLRTRRVHLAGIGVVALEDVGIPAHLLPEGGRLSGALPGALAEAGLHPIRVLERAAAVLLEEDEAAALETRANTPALALTRAYYLADGLCCACSRTVGRPDRYELLVETRLDR